MEEKKETQKTPEKEEVKVEVVEIVDDDDNDEDNEFLRELEKLDSEDADDEEVEETETDEEKEKREKEQREFNKNAEKKRKRLEAEAKARKEEEALKEQQEAEKELEDSEEEETEDDEVDTKPKVVSKEEKEKTVAEQVKEFKAKYPDVNMNELSNNKQFQKYLNRAWTVGGVSFTQLYEDFVDFTSGGKKETIEEETKEPITKKGTPTLKGGGGQSGSEKDIYTPEEMAEIVRKMPTMTPKQVEAVMPKLMRSNEHYEKK